MSRLHAHVVCWDWRGQPDLVALAGAITQVSGGTVHLVPVDTGSDEVAVVVADQPISDARAQAIWQADGG